MPLRLAHTPFQYHRGRAVVSSQYGNVVLGWVFEGVAPVISW